MMLQYYRFRETNQYTGEKSEYCIPLTEKQHRVLAERIERNDAYELSAENIWWSGAEVDRLIESYKNSTSHVPMIAKCYPPKFIPKADNFNDFDPFYAGGAWKIESHTDKEEI